MAFSHGLLLLTNLYLSLSVSFHGVRAQFFPLLSSVLLYNVLGTPSVLEEHLSGFPCMGFMEKKKAATNMRVQLSVWTEVYNSFGQISGSVNPGSDGKNYVEL